MQAQIGITRAACPGVYVVNPVVGRRQRLISRGAVDQDLDWEPASKNASPSRGGPPRKPPPRSTSWFEWPFQSRRNIALTLMAGTASLWLVNHKLGPIEFADQPPTDINFSLTGYTDMKPDDFVYFKTRKGSWLAAAEDDQGRLFMIDQIGDLYYDSGNPNVGTYAMDISGNLFNFYIDVDGQQKITPVGNVSDLRKFKINEIAGLKLDRDVQVVAFQDGNTVKLPPTSGMYTKDGKYIPPRELEEGFQEPPRSPFARIFEGSGVSPDRFEVDLNDPAPFERQMFDQVLLDDPDLPGYQPALPKDFDLNKLAQEVIDEEKKRR